MNTATINNNNNKLNKSTYNIINKILTTVITITIFTIIMYWHFNTLKGAENIPLSGLDALGLLGFWIFSIVYAILILWTIIYTTYKLSFGLNKLKSKDITNIDNIDKINKLYSDVKEYLYTCKGVGIVISIGMFFITVWLNFIS